MNYSNNGSTIDMRVVSTFISKICFPKKLSTALNFTHSILGFIYRAPMLSKGNNQYLFHSPSIRQVFLILCMRER